MQTNEIASHAWLWTLLGLLLGAGGLAGFYKIFLERKKPQAEINLTDAQAGKERAETRKIDADVTKTYNDIIRDINKDLREALKENEELVDERDEWKRRAGQIPHLEDEIKLYVKQVSDLECIISASGINKGDVLDKIKGVK